MFKILHIPTGCFIIKTRNHFYLDHSKLRGSLQGIIKTVIVKNKLEFLRLFINQATHNDLINDIFMDLEYLGYCSNIDISDFELCRI